MTKIFITLMLIKIILSSPLYSQWFDEKSLNATILIEKDQDGTIVPHGTGFLFWNYKYPTLPIVVTNAHLLNRSKIYVTLNADSSFVNDMQDENITSFKLYKRMWYIENYKLRCPIKLTKTPHPTYVTHDSLDIGAFLIDMISALSDSSGNIIKRFSTIQKIPNSYIRWRKDVSLGDELYFVGFPLGIGVDNILTPVVRSASAAWLSPDSTTFLLDALSYGGNSGSPIFSKRILGRKVGTISWDKPYLVGMVSGHISQKTIDGILTQPDPKVPIVSRVSVEENVGLVQCIWIDDIIEVIKKTEELEIIQ